MPQRPSARLALRLTPTDVGRRVTVRSALPDDRYSDTIGTLESWSDGILTIRRRDDSVVQVREDSLVAGKVVPPPPQRRRPR